jgi:hypothetical protein
MKFSPLPCYLVPLRPKYSQYPILKHPQPTFLLIREHKIVILIIISSSSSS